MTTNHRHRLRSQWPQPPPQITMATATATAADHRRHCRRSQSRYNRVKQINLEFAQDIEDKHLDILRSKVKQQGTLKV
ncbi:hypothetical protein ACSBR2_032586 [Camellia fascicularis]